MTSHTVSPARRLKLTPRECRWLSEVDAYVRQYNCRGQSVLSAFSDVHDGNLYPREVAALARKRIIIRIPIPADERSRSGLMGDAVTYDLTLRAAQTLWPERMSGTP